MRKIGLLVLSLIVCLPIGTYAQRQLSRNAADKHVSFKHDGRERNYILHVPASYKKSEPCPLVVCLHGGGGDAQKGAKMGLTPVADKHGFIAVYPGAIDKHWNDGRKSERFAEHDRNIDDVKFIKSVIERVTREYNIDKNRIFATGASNGGFMTQRLAIEMSDTFSAVGIFIASMGEPLSKDFDPDLPVSVMYMNGTEDPMIPYEGGEVVVELAPRLNRLRQRSRPSRGKCISTEDAVQHWVKRNRIETEPEVMEIDDKNQSDGCHVQLSLWKNGERGTAVALYKVVGGGHTLPGGRQYLPQRLVGKTNKDIEAFETMWQFFKTYARQPTQK